MIDAKQAQEATEVGIKKEVKWYTDKIGELISKRAVVGYNTASIEIQNPVVATALVLSLRALGYKVSCPLLPSHPTATINIEW